MARRTNAWRIPAWIPVAIGVGLCLWITITSVLALQASPWTGITPNGTPGGAIVASHVWSGSPAALAGIRTGDTLVGIAGEKPAAVGFVRDRDYLSTWTQEKEFWAVRNQMQQLIRTNIPLVVQVRRQGTIDEFLLVPDTIPMGPLLLRLAPFLLVSWSFLACGAFIVWRNWSVASICLLISGSCMCVTISSLVGFNSRDLSFPVATHHFLQIMNEIGAVTCAFTMAQFAWHFPRQHPFLRRIPFIQLLPGLLTTLFLTVQFCHLLPGPVYAVNLPLIISALLIAAGLISGYAHLGSPILRRQIRWIGIAIVAGMTPLALFTVFPVLLRLPFLPEDITFLATILIPAGIVYSSINGKHENPSALLLRLLRLKGRLRRHEVIGIDGTIQHFLDIQSQGENVVDSLKHTLQDVMDMPWLEAGSSQTHPWIEANHTALEQAMTSSHRPFSGEELVELLAIAVPAEIEASYILPLHGLEPRMRLLMVGPRWNPDGWNRTDRECLAALITIVSPLLIAEEKNRIMEAQRRSQLLIAKEELEHRVKERTSELAASNRQLSEALQAREDFLAAMSHELRTPLATLLGGIEALQHGIDGRIEPKMRTRLESMERNGQHLQELIGDVLDFARGRAGKLTILPQTFDLKSVCLQACELVTSRQGHHQIPEVEFPPVLPGAFGDPLRARQILTNLLANAYLHGSGNPLLHLEIFPHHIQVDVLDRGKGIPEHLLPRLFKAFERFEPGSTGTGTGLGLALSHMLAQLMGGSLAYLPREGGGACFRLTLPLSIEPVSQDLEQDSSGLGAGEDLPHILLVEDNNDLRTLLEEYLTGMDWPVEVHTTGLSALDSCHSNLPQILLTDLGLPGMDGLELVRHVRSLPGGKLVKIIVLTGQVMPEDAGRCIQAGVDIVLPKPFPLAKLDKILRTIALEDSRALRKITNED
jgi:signal transduction histidine kinase/ActR/RegA family two-component response regulator